MKCPKCAYLSFEPEPRCKHCGYDFSLSEPDLTYRDEASTSPAPFSDFQLHQDPSDRPGAPVTLGAMRPSSAAQSFAIAGAMAMTLERPEPAAESRNVARPRPARPPVAAVAPVTTELPLFVKGLAQTEGALTEPLAFESEEPIVLPPAPRPLSVRRDAAEPVRQASTEPQIVMPARKVGAFDNDLLEDLQRIEAKAAGRPMPPRPGVVSAGAAGRRLAAASVDLFFLAGILTAIVWFTLRRCGMTFDQAFELPWLPMGLFLALVVVGYLLLFTAASGQTIGKMLAGLRVVAEPDGDEEELPTIRQAMFRALLTVPSVLVLGAGFLPALVRPGLALHDRIAHTRVVRA